MQMGKSIRYFMYLITSIIIIGGIMNKVMAIDLLPSHEYKVRDGLPNVASKLRNGDSVKVIFIGGSITAGGGDHGFTVKVPEWIQATYPKAKVSYINAGIGGTDSKFGAARYDAHVLSYKPDLVFVEFAVNDGSRDNRAEMERIVRKTWMNDSTIDVVFIYTFTKNDLTDYANGKFHIGATYHEYIANFYNVPSIGMSTTAAAKINGGKISAEAFWVDGVHPKSDGYKVYIDAITTALTKMFASGTAGPHHLTSSTFTPNLVVYPDPPVAEPLPTPKPFVNKDGKTADSTWEMPVVNVHWVQDPEYSINGRVRWRLSTMPWEKISKTNGTNQSLWNGLARWITDYFEGPNGRFSAKSENSKNVIIAAGGDMPIVSFVAQKRGLYSFRVTANADFMDRYLHSVSLNCVHFKWGEENNGTSMAFVERDSADLANGKSAIDLRFDVEVGIDGEIISFIGNQNVKHSAYGKWENFNIRVGYYDNLPPQVMDSAWITPSDSTILVNDTVKCNIKAVDKDNASFSVDYPVKWSVSGSDCSINDKGILTTSGTTGKCTVKAEIDTGNGTYTCYSTLVVSNKKMVKGTIIGYGEPIPYAKGYEVALDGKTSTFPDIGSDTAWVGYDFGKSVKITQIRVWPRDKWSERMKGKKIEVSDDGKTWTVVHTIKDTPAEGKWNTISIDNPKSAKMVRYNGAGGYLNVGEIEFYITIGSTKNIKMVLPTKQNINTLLNIRHNIISVRCKGEYTLQIVDLSGRTRFIQKGMGYASYQISSQLGNGSYIAKISGNGKNESRLFHVFTKNMTN